jgi:hypothetical protein
LKRRGRGRAGVVVAIDDPVLITIVVVLLIAFGFQPLLNVEAVISLAL